MQTPEQFDLSTLPEQAQTTLYDFYLFLKQRDSEEQKEHQALQEILDYTKKENIKVDPSINIRELIDQTHDVKI